MFIRLPAVGDDWLTSYAPGITQTTKHCSPIDGSLIQNVALAGRAQLDLIFEERGPNRRPTILELKLLLSSLSEMIHDMREALIEAIQLETGFNTNDASELVDDTTRFLRDFLPPQTDFPTSLQQTYHANGQYRATLLRAVPWGTVAVVLPQNAFLLVAATCMANALATGNRIILRAPLQSSRTALILETAVMETMNLSRLIHFPLCRSLDFLTSAYASESPLLIHYMGGSQHAPDLMAKAFGQGKHTIIDGQGNCWCYVDETADPDFAAVTLCTGSTRFNGQTCTSINGAVIHPAIYDRVRSRLLELMAKLKVGDPRKVESAVGPLFSASQATHCASSVSESGGTVLVGGGTDECYFEPTLVEEPHRDSQLVSDGIFGCCLWISTGTRSDFTSRWGTNKYPLCAAIIGENMQPVEWASDLANVARLTINADPTVEDPFAPWGGYPASGVNPVTDVFAKYQRVVQVDIPAPEQVFARVPA